jgi:hypothetical protein
VKLFGRRTRLATRSEIRVEAEDGTTTTAKRDDTSYQAGASFGYRFRPRLRLSLDAQYFDRRSNFDAFGIRGLLTGFAVQFTPGGYRPRSRR